MIDLILWLVDYATIYFGIWSALWVWSIKSAHSLKGGIPPLLNVPGKLRISLVPAWFDIYFGIYINPERMGHYDIGSNPLEVTEWRHVYIFGLPMMGFKVEIAVPEEEND